LIKIITKINNIQIGENKGENTWRITPYTNQIVIFGNSVPWIFITGVVSYESTNICYYMIIFGSLYGEQRCNNIIWFVFFAVSILYWNLCLESSQYIYFYLLYWDDHIIVDTFALFFMKKWPVMSITFPGFLWNI